VYAINTIISVPSKSLHANIYICTLVSKLQLHPQHFFVFWKPSGIRRTGKSRDLDGCSVECFKYCTSALELQYSMQMVQQMPVLLLSLPKYFDITTETFSNELSQQTRMNHTYIFLGPWPPILVPITCDTRTTEPSSVGGKCGCITSPTNYEKRWLPLYPTKHASFPGHCIQQMELKMVEAPVLTSNWRNGGWRRWLASVLLKLCSSLTWWSAPA
jgi:hypothetical protein